VPWICAQRGQIIEWVERQIMLHSVQVIKWAAMFVLVISIVVMSSFQRISFSIFSHLQIKEKGVSLFSFSFF
jgi:hypothetical protein